MKTLLHYLFVLFCTLAFSVTGYAQLNYTQNFENDQNAWYEDDFYWLDYLPCDGTASLAGVGEIWFGFAFGSVGISENIGISNGQLATLSYNYKLLDVDTEEALANSSNWGEFTIEYASSPAGPWTLFQTVNTSNHIESSTCALKTATFTPPPGSNVYFRVTISPDDSGASPDVYYALIMDSMTVTQAPAPGCTGAPVASAAVAASAVICNQQSASLSLSPFYTATGLTFQWQKSTDGTNYTNITGATAATLTTPQTVNTWYKAIITCTASSTSVTSAPVQITNSGLNCMCDVQFANNIEPITNVTFAGINNTTSATVNGTPAVQNFAGIIAPALVYKDSSYPISLQGNTDGTTFTTFFKVFIDFNQNGNLDEAGESFAVGSVTGSTGTDGQMATGNILIPSTALTGITYMRVIKLYSSAEDGYPDTACPEEEEYGYGQVEDYLLNIQPCTTVAPVAAAAQTFCQGATVANLAVTGTGVKWYAAAAGGTALPSAGALVNGVVYHASQTVGCESVARTPVTVTLTTVAADDPADVASCGSYILPTLTNGAYYTAAAGGGTALLAGAVITETATLHVYATAGICSVDNAFTVTIGTALADDPADVSACDSYTLPALTNGAYYTATGGTGTALAAGASITETATLYVYATSGPTCTTENSFTVTVNNAVADSPNDVSACGSYTLPALTDGAYYTGADGTGNMLEAGDVVTASTTLYVYSAVGTEPSVCTAENSFDIAITALEVDEFDDVTACGEYILPELTNGTYYTGASGLGEMLEAGDVIDQTITLHIYGVSQDNPACTADTAFTVTIVNVEADEADDVSTCDSYILPQLSAGNNYYTASGAIGTQLSAGDVISASQTIYIYTLSSSALCSDETSFEVVVTPIETPEDIIITIENTAGMPVVYTLGDFEIYPDVEGVITVYGSLEDAQAGENALDQTAEITDGTTFYATVTNGDCTSEPFSVTFDVVLGTGKFDMAAFSYYPNPVNDVLNLSYSENITGVEVTNLLGQQIMSGKYSHNEVQLNLSQLASGTYIVKVQTENASKIIKVVKNR